MEAPDKVYVSIGSRQSLIARTGQTLKSDIEYIRKDILLEWARDNRDSAGKISYTELIDKIKSL